MLEKVSKWLSEYNESFQDEVSIIVYDQLFFISHHVQDDKVWVDLAVEDVSVRVSTEKELVTFIRDNVAQSPLFDDVILFNVEDAVWMKLRFLWSLEVYI